MMDIDTLEAGNELDDLISEKVMGWVYWTVPPDINGEHGGNQILVPPNIDMDNLPSWALPGKGPITGWRTHRWSTDLDAAWRVVTRIARGLIQFRYECAGPFYYAKFVDCRDDKQVVYGAKARTIELAICRAALKMIAQEEK